MEKISKKCVSQVPGFKWYLAKMELIISILFETKHGSLQLSFCIWIEYVGYIREWDVRGERGIECER